MLGWFKKSKEPINSKKLTACYYHVTYGFQGESTLYSCLTVKELLAWNRHDILCLSDSNGICTHNHLVHKRTLNHLAKMARLAKWSSVCYKLSGCGFKSHCCHLNIRYRTCFSMSTSENYILLFCSVSLANKVINKLLKVKRQSTAYKYIINIIMVIHSFMFSMAIISKFCLC